MNASEPWRNYAEAAVMALHNARRARRMAREWPRRAEQDMADATRCYRSGLYYLATARRLRSMVAEIVEVEYADAA